MYILKFVKYEILKTNIKKKLANTFINLLEYFLDISVFFIRLIVVFSYVLITNTLIL